LLIIIVYSFIIIIVYYYYYEALDTHQHVGVVDISGMAAALPTCG
jgi:hypothetical protein